MQYNKARFITFEGGDGSGKTTLIEKCSAYLTLQGYSVLKTRAPGGTAIGEEIRQLLLKNHQEIMAPCCELFLFLADRAQHVDALIRPALARGMIVLCDRFNDSTLAYQGSRGHDAKQLEHLLHIACSGLMPHLTLYLDLDPEEGFKRTSVRAKDRIESEHIDFHRNIRKAFCKIARDEPKRFVLIDAALEPESVFACAKEKIDELLSANRK